MFVFVYLSCHLNLPFPHLVVILTTLEAPKNIFCVNNNIMNDNSKQDHPWQEHYEQQFTKYEKNNNRAL